MYLSLSVHKLELSFSGIVFHILRLNQDSSSGQPNGHTSPFQIFGVLEISGNYTISTHFYG